MTTASVTYESALKELLELFAFEPDEIETEWPRIKKTFDIWEITAEDIVAAIERANQYYDLSLKGVRMILNIHLRELCHVTLAGEEKEKRIYTVMPCNIGDLITAFAMVHPNCYAGFPDFYCFLTLGTLFKKTGAYMDEAEKWFMYPGEGHCTCNMFRAAALQKKKYPKPDVIVTYSHYCDEAWKNEEFLHTYLGINYVTVDRTQDTPWEHGKDTINWRNLRFYVESMKQARQQMEEIIGLKITDDDLGASLMDTGYYAGLINRIVELATNTDPAPITFKDIVPAIWISMCGVMPDNRPRRKAAIETLWAEVQERAAKGEGPLPKGSPRYMSGGFAFVIDPLIPAFLEEQGLVCTCAEACYWMPNATLDPPMLGSPGLEPTEEFAAGGIGIFEMLGFGFYLAGIPNSLSARVQMVDKTLDNIQAGAYPVDGVIMPGHYPCRVYGTDSLVIKDVVDKKGIPNMALELDQFDTRYYSFNAMRTKLEAFVELVKLHHVTKG